MSKVKNPKLANKGRLKIEWAEAKMPVLMQIRKEFSKSKPFKGLTLGACLHVTKETAVLMRTLKAGGAKVAVCGSNPLSTQDDIAAALAKDGIHTFAWRGVTPKEYYWCLNKVLDLKPNITMDDGADLITMLHTKRKELVKKVLGGTEETTTGVIRFRAMEKDRALKFPVVAVNDAKTKHMFDNFYGTGQSTIDGILRATNALISGTYFVVAGYGWCSRGIAMRAHGMGAKVIVTEVDSVRALQAAMDGFTVMTMSRAARVGDIFVTATGCNDILRKEHFKAMKDGAILANSGHFDVEINIPDLKKLSKRRRVVRDNVEEFTLRNGNRIYLLGEGRLINLAAAEGHPSEVMDMSFANQALCAEHIAKNRSKLRIKLYSVPEDIDKRIASMKLHSMGMSLDRLTPLQKKYLGSWQEGT
ncbi:TPA: adenosylhomocysteinase [archaeon]|nr:adenosylhomocysteinase [Candidatus Naiadarchaeales archaeon SRR2090159.bin1288]